MLGKVVLRRSEVSSTQDWLKDLLSYMKTSEGIICVADKQTRGKGRFGREWVSDEGGVYMSFSLIWPDNRPNEIGFYVAVGLCEAVRTLYKEDDLRIKWPNDIYVREAKLAGILIEKAFKELYICGIGVNVEVAPRVKEKKTICLRQLGIESSREEFLFLLIDKLNWAFALDFEDVFQHYKAWLWNIPGQWLALIDGRQELITVREVFPSGRLLTDKGKFDYINLLEVRA